MRRKKIDLSSINEGDQVLFKSSAMQSNYGEYWVVESKKENQLSVFIEVECIRDRATIPMPQIVDLRRN